MTTISIYDEALKIIKQHPGTGGAGSLAKLVLSLYNDMCGFSFAECVGNLDDRLTNLALRMVSDYAKHGETEDLRAAGKVLVEEYPGLWEMSLAMRDARQATRERWERERKAEEEKQIHDTEKAFMENVHNGIPFEVAKKLLKSDHDTLTAYYFSMGDWRHKEIPVGEVLDAVQHIGTDFISVCPDAGGTVGVVIGNTLYHVLTDWEAREEYYESRKTSV